MNQKIIKKLLVCLICCLGWVFQAETVVAATGVWSNTNTAKPKARSFTKQQREIYAEKMLQNPRPAPPMSTESQANNYRRIEQLKVGPSQSRPGKVLSLKQENLRNKRFDPDQQNSEVDAEDAE